MSACGRRGDSRVDVQGGPESGGGEGGGQASEVNRKMGRHACKQRLFDMRVLDILNI